MVSFYVETVIVVVIGYMLLVKNHTGGGYVVREVQLYDMISY